MCQARQGSRRIHTHLFSSLTAVTPGLLFSPSLHFNDAAPGLSLTSSVLLLLSPLVSHSHHHYYFTDAAPSLSLTSSVLLLLSPLVSHYHLHYNFIDAAPGLSLTSSVLLFCCRPWSLILTFTTISLMPPLVSVSPLQFSY